MGKFPGTAAFHLALDREKNVFTSNEMRSYVIQIIEMLFWIEVVNWRQNDNNWEPYIVVMIFKRFSDLFSSLFRLLWKVCFKSFCNFNCIFRTFISRTSAPFYQILYSVRCWYNVRYGYQKKQAIINVSGEYTSQQIRAILLSEKTNITSFNRL